MSDEPRRSRDDGGYGGSKELKDARGWLSKDCPACGSSDAIPVEVMVRKIGPGGVEKPGLACGSCGMLRVSVGQF